MQVECETKEYSQKVNQSEDAVYNILEIKSPCTTENSNSQSILEKSDLYENYDSPENADEKCAKFLPVPEHEVKNIFVYAIYNELFITYMNKMIWYCRMNIKLK